MTWDGTKTPAPAFDRGSKAVFQDDKGWVETLGSEKDSPDTATTLAR
jgi:hypothetical protein